MPTAAEIALKYMSPRYLRLERHEKYIEGTQYDGRWPFLAQGDEAPPVQERAPCVVDGVAKTAIGDLIDFMLGDTRYPHVSAASSEDDEELDDEWGLNEADSGLLERWVNGPLTKSARLKAMLPDGLAMAMSAGGVAMVGVVKNGMPTLQALPAKWCAPTFNTVTGEVIALEVFYPYIIETQDQDGKWVEKCKLYKRRIDTTTDTVYLPGDGREDGKPPAWAVDASQTMVHGLGYCPVRWYAFDRLIPTAAHYDGKPLHGHLHDELDANNLSLSQRHRAALYCGDPQMWETGVEPDVNPAPSGRVARVTVEAQAAGPNGQRVGVFTSAPQSWGGRGAARKKGPGVVWRYPAAEAKVGMLTLPSDALGSISENADDIREKLAEAMSVVLIKPQDAKVFGALSGKALAFLFARQVARADRIRQDAGDNLVLACIDLLLRLCLSVERTTPGGLRLPGMKKILPLLEGFEQDQAVPGRPATPDAPETPATTVKAWFGPRLELQWGPYFSASAEEENFVVTMCVQAYTNTLMPLELILEKLRDIFPFGSTEELMARLEEAAQKKQEDALAIADATAANSLQHTPGEDGKAPSGGKPVFKKSDKPGLKPVKKGGKIGFKPSAKGSASGAAGDKKA